jgi:hypothetical protein
MPKKRSSFWTVVFACMPGAGQMFMGFMKLGASIMGLFFLIIFVAQLIGFDALILANAVLWFYAFFDCINRRFSSDEEFVSMKDHYLFQSPDGSDNILLGKGRLVTGLILLVVGACCLWKSIFSYVSAHMPQYAAEVINEINVRVPQVLVASAIIALGVWLICFIRRSRSRK